MSTVSESGRHFKQLDSRKRYELELLLKLKTPKKKIAAELGCSISTVYREIERGQVEQVDTNLIKYVVYKAYFSDGRSKERANLKGRKRKLSMDIELSEHIRDKILNMKYSPDAVLGEIRRIGLKFKSMICTKTLYNYIDNGLLSGVSNDELPVKRFMKRRGYHPIKRQVSYNNVIGLSIEERPVEANDRQEGFHWEMDSVLGSSKSKACLLVLTERKSRLEKIVFLPNKSREAVIGGFERLKAEYGDAFKILFKTMTSDNGVEFLGIEEILRDRFEDFMTSIYYAHPYSSWERGSNEVGNKLIRRFIPKGIDIGEFSEAEIKVIENWMNNYPRRQFWYGTAAEEFRRLVKELKGKKRKIASLALFLPHLTSSGCSEGEEPKIFEIAEKGKKLKRLKSRI
jgi:IS30 family transposase